MAFKLVPRGWETSSTTGTGALTLAGAVTDYPNTGDTWRAFSDDLSNNDTTYYAVVNRGTQTEWEEGIGTWGTGGILTRTTIIRSSNSNNAVSFSAGTKDVMCTPITSAAVSPGTSGGVLYFSAANTPASSAALAANAVVLGGGAATAPFTSSNLTFADTGWISTYPLLSIGGTFSAIRTAGTFSFQSGTTELGRLGTVNFAFPTATYLSWGNSATPTTGTDANFGRGGANQFYFSGAGTSAGSATTRAEINKAVTAFTDAVAKTVFTLTIPNAAHSASYLVRLTGSIGAGGAVGANEASATNAYIVTICRTAGVNAVAGISAAFGASTSAVAGATTVTCTGALAAVSGAVGAVNTIDIQATITKGGGASDNHTCVAYAQLLNANATGITIA